MFMMARVYHLLLVVLTTQLYVNAAPSDVTKLDDIAKVEIAGLETNPSPVDISSEEDAGQTQGLRQKRWYDFGQFGFPPPISPIFPSYVKRDDSRNTGVYGLVDDPLTQVFRRIQDIASFSRQPNYPPALPPHFPVYLPVLYVPRECNCNSQNPPQNNQNGNEPEAIDNRFPEMEDTRQNWGYVDDEVRNSTGEDFRRPINFNPIRSNKTMNRQPPPVEHGSVQGDGNSNGVKTLSETPTTSRVPITTRRPPLNVPQAGSNELPTNCDAAILSCCHRPEITAECFSTQGCPDATSRINPCEPSVILRVIERFQRFYLQRTG